MGENIIDLNWCFKLKLVNKGFYRGGKVGINKVNIFKIKRKKVFWFMLLNK